MSTKILVAWRMPKEKLNDFLRFAWSSVYTGFYKYFDMLIGLVKDEEVEPKLYSTFYREDIDGQEQRVRAILRLKERLVVERCKLAWSNGQDILYNVQSGFNVWFDDEYAYAIPWGDADKFMRNTGVTMPEWCEDYHYQDQCDSILPPEEDEARAMKWEELCLDDWDVTRLRYDIINFEPGAYRTGYEVEMQRRRLEKEDDDE